MVSKTNVAINSWTGCGYIIIDPDTGEGAYMISGGLNGAYYYFLCAIEVILHMCVYSGYIAVGLLAAIAFGPAIFDF